MIMSVGLIPPIPGLIYIPNFIKTGDLLNIRQDCLSLYN